MVEITTLSAAGYAEMIVLGLGAGTLGTLVGAGGAFILLPALLLLYPHENPAVLGSITLAVVFFGSVSGTEAYALMRRVDFKSGLLFACGIVPGSVLGALTSSHVPSHAFEVFIACLMIGAAVYLILKRNAHEHIQHYHGYHAHQFSRSLVERDGTQVAYAFNPFLGIGVSFVLGYVSGLAGIGGGIFFVPVLIFLLGFPLEIAIGTSRFSLAILAFSGTLTHIVSGQYSHAWHLTMVLAISVVVGAQLGARLSKRIKSDRIINILAVMLGIAGIHILITSFL